MGIIPDINIANCLALLTLELLILLGTLGLLLSLRLLSRRVQSILGTSLCFDKRIGSRTATVTSHGGSRTATFISALSPRSLAAARRAFFGRSSRAVVNGLCPWTSLYPSLHRFDNFSVLQFSVSPLVPGAFVSFVTWLLCYPGYFAFMVGAECRDKLHSHTC